MKKNREILAGLIICMLLTGCSDNVKEENSIMESGEMVSVTEGDGIYYDKIDDTALDYVSEGAFSHFVLKYGGNMYISSYMESQVGEAITDVDAIAGQAVGQVYRAVDSSGFRSTDSSDFMHVSDSLVSGTLYTVNGYDESFRVCVYEEYTALTKNEKVYELIVYDRLNDIWLDEGRELYQDRLHIDRSVAASLVEYGNVPAEYCDVDIEADEYSEFLQALFNGKFIDRSDSDYLSASAGQWITCIFYDTSGLENVISISPDGYVLYMDKSSGIIEKVDADACRRLIELAAG